MGSGRQLLRVLGLRKWGGRRPLLGKSEHHQVFQSFDRSFYLTKYHDVARSGIDPLDHYLRFGWKEGRDPASWFSTNGYLKAYADIATSGQNPFVHYVMFGKAEGRSAAPERDVSSPWLDDMVRYPEQAVAPLRSDYDPRQLRIHWVIADFSPAGGGHMNIFRTIHWLEAFGHVCKIWINRPSIHKDARDARLDIGEQFIALRAQVGVLSADFFAAEGDVVVATSWETVWPVSHATGFKERFYFVQDFEPAFYPAGSLSVAAEASYRRDLACICAGPWLGKMLKSKYGRWTRSYRLSCDRDIYAVRTGARGGAVPRIAVYGRQLTPRRMVEFVFSALVELVRRRAVFHVDLFGSHSVFNWFPFSFTNHGILTQDDLARLYNDCDIGICLSATNYSLVDMEMMSCGLPVIEFDGENTRTVFPPGVVTFAGPDPGSLADAIEGLLSDPALRRTQADRALRWARKFSWEKSARTIESAILSRLKGRGKWQPVSASSHPDVMMTAGAERMADAGSGPLGTTVFAGQPEYYRSAYFDGVRDGRHFEFPIDSASPGSRLQGLCDFVQEKGAKTCIVFRPEWLAECEGLTEELRIRGIRVIGISTEPVPTGKTKAHPDQLLRFEYLRRAQALPLDLLVHYDPASGDFLRKNGFRRVVCHPLPVSRSLFYPEQCPVEFDACFLGRSTPHREELLSALKREAKIVHIAHGLVDEQARSLMNRSRVVLNIHCESYDNFESRAVQALRCCRPLVSDRLNGTWLRPDRDYHLAQTAEEFLQVVRQIAESQAELPAPDLTPFDLETLLTRIAGEI